MLQTSFTIAFIVYFLRATTWKGMIFSFVEERAGKLPEYIRKPLYVCPICMTPWWGTAIYLAGHYAGLVEFKELTFLRLIFTLFTASGINTIFVFIHKMERHLRKSFIPHSSHAQDDHLAHESAPVAKHEEHYVELKEW